MVFFMCVFVLGLMNVVVLRVFDIVLGEIFVSFVILIIVGLDFLLVILFFDLVDMFFVLFIFYVSLNFL